MCNLYCIKFQSYSHGCSYYLMPRGIVGTGKCKLQMKTRTLSRFLQPLLVLRICDLHDTNLEILYYNFFYKGNPKFTVRVVQQVALTGANRSSAGARN